LRVSQNHPNGPLPCNKNNFKLKVITHERETLKVPHYQIGMATQRQLLKVPWCIAGDQHFSSTTEFEHIFFPEEKSWVAPMNHKKRYTLPNSEFLEPDGEINQASN
jgi:hypothetical protein